jgi:monoamine oxidase
MDCDVVVVGGGLAGLIAASILLEAGATVELLEARASAGGRIRAIMDPITGHKMQAGGELVGRAHTSVRKWSDHVGLTLLPRAGSSSSYPDEVLVASQWLSYKEIERLRSELDEVTDELSSLSRKLIRDDGDDVVRRSHESNQANQLTVDDWLAQRGRSVPLRRTFSDLPRNAQSLWGLLCLIAGGGYEEYFISNEEYTIAGGASELTNRLARRLSHAMRFGYPLTMWTCKLECIGK